MTELAWQNAHLSLAIDVPVPVGCSLEGTLNAVRALLERHEVLRTLFHARDDGAPRQRVLASGEIDVVLSEEATDRPLSETLAAYPFGPDELPVRVGILTRSGEPRVVSLALSHLAVDGWSRSILVEELTALLAGEEESLRPVVEQPVDRAAYEASPAGQRAQLRSLAYWRSSLASLPGHFFHPRMPPPEEYESATLTSPAVAAGLGVLARRYGVSPSVCMLATVALAVGVHQRVPCGALWMIVATRFRRESARLVAAFNQNALMHPDWTVRTYGEFVQAVAQRRLLAYRNSEYALDQLLDVCDEVAAERGGSPPRGCYYNDVSPLLGTAEAAQTEVPADELFRMRALSTVTRRDELEGQIGHQLFINVRSLTAPSAVLLATVDREAVLPGGAVRLLTDVESVVLAAAAGERTLDEMAALVDSGRSVGQH